jgi:hypothetical protein
VDSLWPIKFYEMCEVRKVHKLEKHKSGFFRRVIKTSEWMRSSGKITAEIVRFFRYQVTITRTVLNLNDALLRRFVFFHSELLIRVVKSF